MTSNSRIHELLQRSSLGAAGAQALIGRTAPDTAREVVARSGRRPPFVVLEGGDEKPDWQASAKCADADPDLFVAPAPTRVEIEQAKAICAQCPVREQCLQHAIEAKERFGIWGGLTPGERERFTRSAAGNRPETA